jgi:DNA-directed RNA polymerase specialized sigma24 family protein
MRVNGHKPIPAGVVTDVDAAGEALGRVKAAERSSDLETIFKAHYERIARVIVGVIRDRARAEELAVDVFLNWSSRPEAHGDKAEGWLYRAAVRTGLNELRREMHGPDMGACSDSLARAGNYRLPRIFGLRTKKERKFV